jgi:FkbH-like protein
MSPPLATPTRAVHARWRALQEDPAGLRPLTVALCASFTSEPLWPHLGCALADRGLFARFVAPPFGQIYQALLDATGPVRAAAPDLTVILPRAEDLCAPALRRLATLDPPAVEAARAEAHAEIERLCQALSRFTQESAGSLLCATLPPPPSTPLGVLDASHPASERHLRAELNLRLFKHAQRAPRTRLFDLAAIIEAVGTDRAYDSRLFYLSRCPFSREAQQGIAAGLARAIAPLFSAPAKVIVLDLDHTLWGGVVGEDGPAGLAISDAGLGAAFAAFQEALLCLRHQGVLLCVASKNNEADALEVLDHHPGMRLRRHHLSAWRIGWQAKSESLRALAQELGLGLDAFVFIDDNPVECAEVRQQLPQVTVLQLPQDPADYVAALRALPALDRMSLTAEDRLRPEHYAAHRARRAHEAAAPPLAEGAARDPEALTAHLRDLGLRLSVRRLRAEDVPRAAQLTQKTNQFNLTTIRRTEAEMEALRRDPACAVYVAEVADRYGAYGLTALAILTPVPGDEAAAALDTLLLSCRVLGRGVETGLLQVIARDLCRAGKTRLLGRFVPTAKNAPARGFLQAHGFVSISISPGGPPGAEAALLSPIVPAKDAPHLNLEIAEDP